MGPYSESLEIHYKLPPKQRPIGNPFDVGPNIHIYIYIHICICIYTCLHDTCIFFFSFYSRTSVYSYRHRGRYRQLFLLGTCVTPWSGRPVELVPTPGGAKRAPADEDPATEHFGRSRVLITTYRISGTW